MSSSIMMSQPKRITPKRAVVGLSEAHLALAQQLAHVGSWELDLVDLGEINSNVLRWSDETFRLLGYTPGEVEPSNKLFFRAVHPDDREAIRSAVARSVRDHIPYNIEHRVIWRDGTERVLHEQSTIVYDDTGKPLKMLGVVQDITGRKKAIADLELQSMILRHVADNVVATDLKGRVIYWNAGAQQVFQYTLAEMIGQSLTRLYPAGEMEELGTEIQTVLSTEFVVSEWEAVRKDGQRVWLDIRTSVLRDALKRPIGILRIGKDITQYKRELDASRYREPLYQAVGEAIDYGVWSCDSKGRLTHMSDSFLNLLGLTRQQNISDGWRNALHPNERDTIMEEWKKCFAQGKPWNRRYEVLGADGQYHPVLTRAAPFRDQNGRIVCWAGLNIDARRLE